MKLPSCFDCTSISSMAARRLAHIDLFAGWSFDTTVCYTQTFLLPFSEHLLYTRVTRTRPNAQEQGQETG
jgi:hypothetical protein